MENFSVDFSQIEQDVNQIEPKLKGVPCKCTKIDFVDYIDKNDVAGQRIDFNFAEVDSQQNFLKSNPVGRITMFRPEPLEEGFSEQDKRNYQNTFKRIYHLFNAFSDEDGIAKEKLAPLSEAGTTFEDIFNTFLSLVPENYNEVPVRVMFVYDARNSSPRLGVNRYSPVISSKNHPVSLKHNPQYDAISIEELPAPERSKTQNADIPTANSTEENLF
jgi:hypothetical protein